MRRWLLTITACCLIGVPAAAQVSGSGKAPPVKSSPNVKAGVPAARGKAPIIGDVYIGERAPDFVLDGSRGGPEKLSKHRGHWVLLAFGERFRDLAGLDTLDVDAQGIGARVIGVCHEKQQTLTSLSERDHIGMLLLADATGEVSAMYGLFDWGASKTETGFFVIDREGTVRLAIIGRLFPPDQMLELLKFATGPGD